MDKYYLFYQMIYYRIKEIFAFELDKILVSFIYCQKFSI